MACTGMPDDQIEGMRKAPFWPGMEAVAPTLGYDHTAILGTDASVPAQRAAQVGVPTLVMYGDASFPFMSDTARTLARAIPHAELRTMPGQSHNVSPEALSPVLVEFFAS